MPFDSMTHPTLAKVAAYVCSDQGAAIARDFVTDQGGDRSCLHGGGLSGAARISDSTPLAQTILAEMGNIPIEMAADCVDELSRSGATVIVIGDRTDLDTYRALRRAGAAEYFGFPVTKDDILAVRPTPDPVKADSTVVSLPKPPAKNPSIAVMGSQGGVGASLLAQNLAFHATHPKRATLRAALIDADLSFGSQAIDLDREGTAGLFDALMAPDRIDDTFIAATMAQLTDSLSLYSHQVRIGQDALAYESGLAGLYPPLCAEFDAVITDLPRDVFLRRDRLAAQIDALVLVIPAGFAGVNAATRLIELITAQAPDLRILPVLSKVRNDANLSAKDIARAIDRPLVATLPRADAALSRAHRAAKPVSVLQPRSAYARAVGTIWAAATSGKRDAEQAPIRAKTRKGLFG